jgi:Arc/MetJ-type ribon-helix-helix transcriptional regulator
MRPDELRRQLQEAYARQDDARLSELCANHSEEIIENFESWLTIPQEIRGDNTAVEAWIDPLVLVARLFENAGYPQLADRLFGSAANPLERWRSSTAIAQQLIDAGEYRSAANLIRDILPELEESSGTAVDDLRPKAYGLLAKALFGYGEGADAKVFMQRALDDCRRVGDEEGVRIYTSNLRVIDAAAAMSSPDVPGEPQLAIRAAVARAQELSDDAEFELSNATLLAMLEDEVANESVAGYRAKIWGLLGLNFYRLGDLAQSRRYTELALQNCHNTEDMDGVRVYSANLQQISTAQGAQEGS